jgi:spermidine/putrescine transport system ATP-binding protein
LALRPEKLNLCEEAESEDKAAAHPEPAFYGTVVDVVFYGTIDKVFVRLDNSNQTVVAYQYFDDVKRWTPDERVGIWWYERDEVKVQR